MPLATREGRFAARHPNLQTCPAKAMTPLVCANSCCTGNSAIPSLDFSQIELRVGAFYCRDSKMLEPIGLAETSMHRPPRSSSVSLCPAIDKNALIIKSAVPLPRTAFRGVLACSGRPERTLRFKAGKRVTKEQCGRDHPQPEASATLASPGWQERAYCPQHLLCDLAGSPALPQHLSWTQAILR